MLQNTTNNQNDGIEISRPSEDDILKNGYRKWPIWNSQEITYKRTYSEREYCFFIEGEVKLVTDKNTEYYIKAGDLVVFNKGCTCNWFINKDVRKHYSYH